MSSDTSIPDGGDRLRPIEIFTNGKYAKAQVTRDLNYYVSVGTPCLVHDHHALGSTIGPIVRWGIAHNMHNDVPEFLCPFNKTTIRSKSYVAYTLQEGMSYQQFLGLKPGKSSRRSLVLPEDAAVNAQHREDKRANWLQLPKGWLTADELDKAADTPDQEAQELTDMGVQLPTPPSVQTQHMRAAVTLADTTEQHTDCVDTCEHNVTYRQYHHDTG